MSYSSSDDVHIRYPWPDKGFDVFNKKSLTYNFFSGLYVLWKSQNLGFLESTNTLGECLNMGLPRRARNV